MQYIFEGNYEAALSQAEAIPDPKVITWNLDHIEVYTDGDILPKQE